MPFYLDEINAIKEYLYNSKEATKLIKFTVNKLNQGITDVTYTEISTTQQVSEQKQLELF